MKYGAPQVGSFPFLKIKCEKETNALKIQIRESLPPPIQTQDISHLSTRSRGRQHLAPTHQKHKPIDAHNNITMRFPPYYYLLLFRFLDSSTAFSATPSSLRHLPATVSTETAPSAPAASAPLHRRGRSRTKSTSPTSIFETNPLKSLFGNVASSISNIQQMARTQRSSEFLALKAQMLASHNIGSWDDIRSSLRAKQTPEETNFRDNLTKGYGKASPLHKLRLFDKSNDENDVRVIFYRDSASWCPYCHKVWMALEEKRIPYRVEKINMRCYGDKPASFLRMQPSGNIPVAIIDGVTYNQSNDIMYTLEEQFPDHKPLIPKDPKQRMKAQELLRLERTLFSAWMSWLTSRDSTEGRLRDNFVSVLNMVEAELSSTKGGFFLAENVSMVDFMFMPFLERMCASMLYFKGFLMRVAPGEQTNYPALNRWCVIW